MPEWLGVVGIYGNIITKPPRPSYAYIRQKSRPSSVQIMACVSVSSTIHYLNKWCFTVVNWTLGKKIPWNLNKNTIVFGESACQHVVCKTTTIFSRPRCDKIYWHSVCQKVPVIEYIIIHTSALWDVLALEELHYMYNVGTGSMVISMGSLFISKQCIRYKGYCYTWI